MYNRTNSCVQNDIMMETQYLHLLLRPLLFVYPEQLSSPFLPDLLSLSNDSNRILKKFTKLHSSKMRMGINLFSAGCHKDETIGHAQQH